MGIIHSCITSWRSYLWVPPTLVSLEAEDEPPKTYSWDKQRSEGPPPNSLIQNESNTEIGRKSGTINGGQFMVRNCQNCTIFLADHINTLTIDDCKNCKIFAGPTKGSIFLRDSSDCTLIAACGQFRTRDCKKINAFLCCSTQPIIESTSSIKFACFQAFYPELEAHFEVASLSPYNNLWWNIHDFTPNPSEGPNWSILGECYKAEEFIGLPDSTRGEIELSFVEGKNSSVVPLTIGTRNRVCNEAILVLIFRDDLMQQQQERAKKVLKKCFEQGMELVKSRCLTLDATDVERLFNDLSVRKFAIKGPLIALHLTGSGSMEKIQEIIQVVIHESGGNQGCIYASKNAQEANTEINNLFRFADAQIGI